jgi:hypothetical protein
MAQTAGGTDARVAALAGLIDYAGLFPPARLDMRDAITGYRAARAAVNGWLVNRFICPASQLGELAGQLIPMMQEGEAPWPIAVTADAGPEGITADVERIARFEDQVDGGARVEVVETPLPAANGGWAIQAARAFKRPVYFEVPWRDEASVALDSVGAARETTGQHLGAKLRCGGIVAEAFPSPAAVAVVLAGCEDRGIPLKATAGLHHPFRYIDPETGFAHHGFVNLLVAATAAGDGLDLATLTEIVGDSDAVAFGVGRGEISWRDRRFGSPEVAAGRDRLLVGYGSCSFDEPVADLTALGILPVDP